MLRKSRLLLTAVVLALTLAGYAASQIRTRVDLVVVPVNVRDNNGNLLTNLNKDDFRILEDGKEQTISNFSVDIPPLSVAIVVDDGVNGTALGRILSEFPGLLSGFRPEDEITLFRYDHNIVRLTDFTADPSQIEKRLAPIAEIAETRPPETDVDPRLDTRPGWLRTLGGIFKGASNGPTGRSTGIPTVDNRIGGGKPGRMLTTAVHDASMALSNRAENRRKVIFLISDGTVDEPRKQKIYSFEQNIQLLLQKNIQLFAVSTPAPLLEGPFGVLGAYSAATGGDVYGGRSEEDMKVAFERLSEEAHKQYVLGYISNNTPAGRPIFRKIDVKSGDPSQGRTVTHRQGYTQYPAQ